ncbi:MAG: hypothetical protein KAJ42_01055, partial [Gemmatimonadetes bacterium]|nr:hypothetical protein [Gemmatimonadota bacterium]
MDSSDHRGCTRSLLGAAVSLYLILLPLGHVLVIPVAGAWGTATDVLLAGLLAVGGIVALRGGIGLGKGMQALDPFHMAMALFLLFAGWILLSSLWSATPDYALAKGGATAALVLGAVCIRRSGLGWGRALDAWLLGAMLAVGVSLLLVVLGPELAGSRLLYRGGGVSGLPIPRLRGPFLHPNMLGDYLVVSGVLLWARWPDLARRARWLAVAL